MPITRKKKLQDKLFGTKIIIGEFSEPAATSSPNRNSGYSGTSGFVSVTPVTIELLAEREIRDERDKMEAFLESVNQKCQLLKLMINDPNEIYYSCDDNSLNAKEQDNEVNKKIERNTDDQILMPPPSVIRSSKRLRNLSKKRADGMELQTPKIKQRQTRSSARLQLLNRSKLDAIQMLSGPNEFKTPVTGHFQHNHLATVTPGPNIHAPQTILRRPAPGETAISLSGSPLLVTCEQTSVVPQITIPLTDGRVMAVLAKDGLKPDDFPNMDEQTLSKLKLLHEFLGLRSNFRERVFGQPFIFSSLIPLLQHHFYTSPGPRKALVLSFHGSPGVGKNFVTELIVNNIYKKGYDSDFVHLLSGLTDFPHSRKIEEYKDDLKVFIENKVKLCERSMFIFDELDKMPQGLLDVLKGYIDTGKRKDGVDFRRAVYIFLSNVGDSHIISEMVSSWRNGMKRGNLNIEQFQKVLYSAIYNEEGFTSMWRPFKYLENYPGLQYICDAILKILIRGLRFSPIIRSSLIDIYLPFLPLEKEHVSKCIIQELHNRNYTEDSSDIVTNIINELSFGPNPENIFATHGCKHIESKVILQIASKRDSNMRYFDEL